MQRPRDPEDALCVLAHAHEGARATHCRHKPQVAEQRHLLQQCRARAVAVRSSSHQAAACGCGLKQRWAGTLAQVPLCTSCSRPGNVKVNSRAAMCHPLWHSEAQLGRSAAGDTTALPGNLSHRAVLSWGASLCLQAEAEPRQSQGRAVTGCMKQHGKKTTSDAASAVLLRARSSTLLTVHWCAAGQTL